ncbi:hypothetical protein N7509_013240 [Penicillium cosmopolitanum]|uniref:Uncharacterized protein n=1 Tax=Penicillium cosmopolitanum TaxID=1131564 RepID=A0A9W9SFN5_9EURO|nr:uncharacterized protein N7509_013240 [Penicillium cosmopolitanum]KAJ5376354.1 hypothetical protein N7509_013240 [Penicillium cosmopolitanum]
MRTSSRTSGMEDQWTGDAGQAPSPLDVDASRESSVLRLFKFARIKETWRIHTLQQSPGRTPIDTESAWHPDSSHLMSSSGFNDSSEGLRSKPMKPKVHIKPMLRKMSRDDAPSTSIDLSRSSTEQEGLGIYMNFERDRRRSESLTGVTYRRTPSGLHHRSTSGTSQLSSATGSSGGKPAASQYVYPMRPTPRAYTPPLSQSYQTSPSDSDGEDDGLEAESRTESRNGVSDTFGDGDPSYTSCFLGANASALIADRRRLPDSSFWDLADKHFEPTIIWLFPRQWKHVGYGVSYFSSVSRFCFPVSDEDQHRPATVQAARQAFEAKEAAKNRRLEKQQIKAEERQTRRRVKRTQSAGPGPVPESPAFQLGEEVSEKTGNTNSNEREPQPKTSKSEGQPSDSWKSQSKSTWVLFMTWLRTRVFKFRRKLKKVN